jgi:hypothetical protein
VFDVGGAGAVVVRLLLVNVRPTRPEDWPQVEQIYREGIYAAFLEAAEAAGYWDRAVEYFPRERGQYHAPREARVPHRRAS